MQRRFTEPDVTDGCYLEAMMNEILVVCPQCEACARMTPEPAGKVWQFTPRRLVCGNCGLVRRWEGNSLGYEALYTSAIEPYFNLPLWLSISCCNQTLWFFNYEHMSLIEQYVQANLREKRPHLEYGWFNASLFNRLPKFIKAAKNRDEVLRAIEKLRSKG